MNPRRVHQLMRAHFAASGAGDAAQAEWINLVDEHGLLMEARAQAILLQPFVEQGTEELLIEVHRKAGDQLPLGEAIAYLRNHVCRSHIRIANRTFTLLAEVAANGVGRSGQAPPAAAPVPSAAATAP